MSTKPKTRKAALDPQVMHRLTPVARRVFNRALAISKKSGCQYVGSDHLLLGLLSTNGTAASAMLRVIGLDPLRLSVLAREEWGHSVLPNEKKGTR